MVPICAAAISSDGTGAKHSALLDFEDYWPRADMLAEVYDGVYRDWQEA